MWYVQYCICMGDAMVQTYEVYRVRDRRVMAAAFRSLLVLLNADGYTTKIGDKISSVACRDCLLLYIAVPLFWWLGVQYLFVVYGWSTGHNTYVRGTR